MNNLESVIIKIENLRDNSPRPILVAIDGRSGVGKSTIAKRIAKKVNGVVIVGDDFYSGGTDNEWKKKGAKEKVISCIDWKRLRKEVLEPLLSGKPASWHPFDFKKGEGLAIKTISAKPTQVIYLDGVYSARPELSDLVDLSILVEAENVGRRKRLVEREGSIFMNNWHSIWDKAEDYYFRNIQPKGSFNFVVNN